MSLSHGFYCLNVGKVIHINYQPYFKESAQVSIHDDLIRYINDTLAWVPCIHLSGNHYKQTHGLSLYGVTIINQDGASMFLNVISSWATLFSNAPNSFELNVGVTVNKDGTVGTFRFIKVERDEFLDQLRVLIDSAEKALTGDYSILHLGI